MILLNMAENVLINGNQTRIHWLTCIERLPMHHWENDHYVWMFDIEATWPDISGQSVTNLFSTCMWWQHFLASYSFYPSLCCFVAQGAGGRIDGTRAPLLVSRGDSPMLPRLKIVHVLSLPSKWKLWWVAEE